MALTLSHELLSAVDVVRRAGERGVAHDVNSERRYVGGPDDTTNWHGPAALLAAATELVAEERSRERCVDEARCDHIDADRRELQAEGRRKRWKRGGGRRCDAETVADPPPARTAHEQEAPARSQLAAVPVHDVERHD